MGISLNSDILESFGINKSFDVKGAAPLTLAYIGDAIYEIIVRSVIIAKSDAAVTKLHKKTISLVNAAAQKQVYETISEKLTDEEIAVFKRGRNAQSGSMPKNASPADYRIATGFEALCGYLYLSGQETRLIELVKCGIEGLL